MSFQHSMTPGGSESPSELETSGWLRVGQYFSLPLSQLVFSTCRSSGPGGQYVNTTDSAVQLHFHISKCPYLPDDVKTRLLLKAAGRINSQGYLVLQASEERSQQRNKAIVFEKLRLLLLSAARKPVVRKATKPTKASIERRLQAKRIRSKTKRDRRAQQD